MNAPERPIDAAIAGALNNFTRIPAKPRKPKRPLHTETMTEKHDLPFTRKPPQHKRRPCRAFDRTLSAARLACITACTALAVLAPTLAHAGFLEDYYDAAGAQTAMTSAGIYQSQGVSLATGGSFVVKVPRREFVPMTLDAPHLKAGCGGIDLFLGAFSLPSRDEFVSFLRSIGSALPGVAFQLALQGLAPDLNEMVTSFRDLIMKYTNDFTDSCRAAENILEASGGSEYLRHMGLRARNALRASGEADDAAEADSLTRTDGGKVLASVPERKDSGGAVVEAAEANLTWMLLRGARLGAGVDQAHLETMMTLLGTTVYKKTGSGESATIRTEDIPGRDILYDVYGTIGDKTASDAKRLVCDEPVRCLAPKETTDSPVNLVNEIYEAARHYQRSLLLRNRAEVTETEITLLANISSIPLLRLVEASASRRVPDLSDSILRIFAEAAAHEGITNALVNLSDEVRRTLASSSARSANDINRRHAERLEARLTEVLADLRARQTQLFDAMARAQAYQVQVEHIERAVFGRAAQQTAQTLPTLQRY